MLNCVDGSLPDHARQRRVGALGGRQRRAAPHRRLDAAAFHRTGIAPRCGEAAPARAARRGFQRHQPDRHRRRRPDRGRAGSQVPAVAGRARPRRAARAARAAGHRQRGGHGNLRAPPAAAARFRFIDLPARVGEDVVHIWRLTLKLLGFIGMTLETLARTIWLPRRWRVTSLIYHMEQTGLDAVPIVVLLSFLIGAVIAFLGATALQRYGATVFTVDLVSYAFLRELAVLLTAILLAGRTASAFTAQIGSMKVNEEVDAMRTMGLDPVELLVLPRVLALVAVMPLLTFLSMMAGVTGGALVCWFALNISPSMFVSVFQTDTPIRYLWLGLAKAPIFAFLIAVIGCLEGFKVQGSAESVGQRTTSSVVQSIFVVILVDALAALFFMEMGW